MTQTADEHALGHSDEIHLPKPTFWPLVLGLGAGLIAFGVILLRGTPLTEVAVGGQVVEVTLGHALLAPGLLILLGAMGGWLWTNVRDRFQIPGLAVEAPKFAMWCFLGTEVIIFGALIIRTLIVWMQDPEAHKILTEPFSSLLLVSLNTFLLLVSSLGVVLALSSIQRGHQRGLAGWLAVVMLLGIAFLSIQGYEYNKLILHEGVTFDSERYGQFASAFFFLTGNHGLHVFMGVIWCLIVLVRALRGGFTQHAHMGVEIFGLYWHFVDVVWIVIFTVVYLI
jgi:heme/copper-type cytochrome/quinol oxidase subunit 3